MTIIMLLILVIVIYIGIPAAIAIGIITFVKHEKKKATERPVVYGPVYRAPKPPKKKLPASSVMLLIGTIFIMLSSITFVAANWFNMEPVARVFALAGAALVAFVICGFLKVRSELVQTSSAFYMIGTLIAIVSFGTAGYYELFGEWFSFEGMGCGTFLAVMAGLAAVSAFSGKNLYKHTAFHYTGFSFISLAIIFLCVQFSDNFEGFAVAIGIAQLIITAVLHIFKPHKKTAVESPAEIIGDISAVIYQLIAMWYVVMTTIDSTFYTFAVLGILFVQLFGYGFLKNQKWMFIIADVVGFYTAFIVSGGIEDEIGEPWAMVLFGAITFVIYILNYIIPNNLTASKVISLVCFIIGAIVTLFVDYDKVNGVNLIFPVVLVGIIMSYCLHKIKDIQHLAGIALPIMPFCIAYSIFDAMDYHYTEYERLSVITYGSLVLIYVLMAAFFLFLPKISFKLHAHHPIQAHTAEYSLMTAAALVLFAISTSDALRFLLLSVTLLHFIISCTMKCNITAAGSIITFIVVAKRAINEYIVSETISIYLIFGLFVLLIVGSRIVFPQSFIYKKEDRINIDVLLPASIIAMFSLSIHNDVGSFLTYIALSILIAAFIKKSTNEKVASILLSCSAFIAALACINRPFLTFDSSMVTSKINLGILLVLGIAYKYIWRNHKDTSKIISTIMFIIAFAGLIFDGMIHDNMLNRIFVLAVTATVLVFSFYAKSKTWFSVSSIALVILTICLTAKYFKSAGWWVYLLAVGVIFIAIAAANEASRKKGESIKDTVTKTFSDWTW